MHDAIVLRVNSPKEDYVNTKTRNNENRYLKEIQVNGILLKQLDYSLSISLR